MEEDILICSCMDLYKNELVKVIKEKDLKTVEEVGDETQAGTICGECVDDIQAILDDLNA
ncbi:(2Fe-2S)-binding protein [Ancylomarina sp. YFZ004]